MDHNSRSPYTSNSVVRLAQAERVVTRPQLLDELNVKLIQFRLALIGLDHLQKLFRYVVNAAKSRPVVGQLHEAQHLAVLNHVIEDLLLLNRRAENVGLSLEKFVELGECFYRWNLENLFLINDI